MELNLLQPTYRTLQKEGLVYRKKITLAPQASLLRVVVRDAPSGTLGSVTVPINQIARSAAK